MHFNSKWPKWNDHDGVQSLYEHLKQLWDSMIYTLNSHPYKYKGN